MKSLLLLCLLVGVSLAESPPGDVVGKLVVGYQGWFAAKGDGSPQNHWVHWTGAPEPAPGHETFELWPDVREYTHTYQTGYKALGNGQPAKLFSSWDDQTVDTHFRWMAENNIDTAALQRFGSHAKREAATRNQMNGIASRVRQAAETHKRKFFIMWDFSGWTAFATEMIEDLDTNLKPLGLFNSSAYARQNGKPVICMWGFGFGGNTVDVAGLVSTVKKLKEDGFYVIGGVETGWLHHEAFMPAFLALDMLQPWTVGRFTDVTRAKAYQTLMKADNDYLKAHNIDYQVVVHPGFAWSNWHNGTKQNQIPRMHGDHMWQQFVNMRELGLKNIYVAMFDEFDEGTAIAKAAETKADTPTDQYFLTLDADGVHVSSDFYLRLTGDGNRMVQGQLPLTQEHPTPHVLSPKP